MPDLPGGPTDPDRALVTSARDLLQSVMGRTPTPTARELADAIARSKAMLDEALGT